MKVLILSVTTGYGHHSTASALADGLTKKGAEVQIVDIYKYLNELIYQTIDKGYTISSKYIPGVYRTFYTKLENKEHSAYSPMALLNSWLGNKFEKFLDEFSPDAIVCTHIFAAQIINTLKERNKLNVPVVGIVTDYTIHPYWENIPYIEYINIASPLLEYRAVKRGISPDHIISYGIPIKSKFSTKLSKEDARNQLSIPNDAKTVLVMCGSMGYGKMNHLVSDIVLSDPSYHVIAVCGNNAGLFKKLTKMKDAMNNSDNLEVFGFTDKVDIMMDAADCIVTKPGGLTSSEALAKHLPMILVSPIPGQEERNIEFLVNNGVAMNVSKTFEIDEALYYMFHSPEKLKNMVTRMQDIAPVNATDKLSDFIMNLSQKSINE